MTIHTRYMKENDCYKTARKNQLKGIMVHSTGCVCARLGVVLPLEQAGDREMRPCLC